MSHFRWTVKLSKSNSLTLPRADLVGLGARPGDEIFIKIQDSGEVSLENTARAFPEPISLETRMSMIDAELEEHPEKFVVLQPDPELKTLLADVELDEESF